MAEIIQFPTDVYQDKDMCEWNGDDWKEFFENVVGDIVRQTGRDEYDVFAEIMRNVLH